MIGEAVVLARTGTPAVASAAAIRRLSLPPVRLSSTGPDASRSGVTAATSAPATRPPESPTPEPAASGPPGLAASGPPGFAASGPPEFAAPAPEPAGPGPAHAGPRSRARSVSVTCPATARHEVAGPSARTPVKGVTAPSGYPGPSRPAYSRGSASPSRPATAAAQVARSQMIAARPARATKTGSTRVIEVCANTVPAASSDTRIVPAKLSAPMPEAPGPHGVYPDTPGG